MNNTKILGVVFLIFIFESTVTAQVKPLHPLVIVLDSLETKFDVVFSYHDTNVIGVLSPLPESNLTLAAALIVLKKSTGLEFEQINDRFITVYKSMSTKINICGYIKDKETNEAIDGAAVHAKDVYAISNDLGYFEISVDFKLDTVIFIRHIGYRRKKIFKNKWSEECGDIYLVNKPIRLKEVVVKNYLTKGINKLEDGSLRLNVQSVNILPGVTEPDVLYTLQVFPGINSLDETVSNINIRGGTNDQNLILWDGVRMYQSGHFFGLISAINPYFSRRTTLIKNGTSASQGYSVSGTINSRSDNRIAKSFKGSAGINLINADVEFKIPVTKKSSLHIGLRRSISDIITTPVYKQYFNRVFKDTEISNPSNTIDTLVDSNENFKFIDLNIKYLINISRKDRLRIGLFSFSNSLKYQESELVNGAVESKISSLEQDNLILNIRYNRFWNKKIRTSVSGYLSFYKLNSLNFDILKAQRLIQENEITDVGFKVTSRYIINRKIDIFSGYQFSEVTAYNLEDINNPNFEIATKNRLGSHALFLESNLKFSAGKTNLRFGLRGNYLDKYHRFILEPRLAFNQKFLSTFSLEILAEAKHQTAIQIIDSQDDFLGLENKRWVLSNEDDIPIIQSRQLSLGINYHKNDLLISADAYYKNVDGIISSSQGFQNQFEYIRSSGSYDVYGIDVLVNKRFTLANTWISYAYAKNNYFFKDFTPATFPNNLDITHSLSLGISYNINHFELSAGVNYRSGKPFTQPVNENSIVDDKIIYKSPNGSQLEFYSRLDMSAKYNFNLSKKVKALVGISVWNVLNKKNIINVHYHINEANEIEQIKQEALGIVPNLNFRVYF